VPDEEDRHLSGIRGIFSGFHPRYTRMRWGDIYFSFFAGWSPSGYHGDRGGRTALSHRRPCAGTDRFCPAFQKSGTRRNLYP
jgi:hypothetical protein